MAQSRLVTKAVIAAAGYGSRFLPVTKTIAKPMLPVLNRPLIEYIVEDLVGAGIRDIYIIVAKGNDQIKRHFSPDPMINSFLRAHGKIDRLARYEEFYQSVRLHFVEQDVSPDAPHGTTIPFELIKDQISEGEYFLMLMGDDYVYNSGNDIKMMLEYFASSDGDGLVVCQERPEDQLYRYGVFGLRQQDGKLYIDDVVEKPEPGQAPSNLINLARYIFDSRIFDYTLRQVRNGDLGLGEYLFTIPMLGFAKDYRLDPYLTEGKHLDCGNLEGWLETNNFFFEKL
ncbi:NTP transferase domain-containing protein [Candidatus Saccharibacteria bacterium]|nr:NTP transferase domain-containing protein [Candidatus Saccharibacteria bacterium]